MKGKHAKNTANKQKLAKRMLALCFAVVFLCSCVLPVFATGSSLLTDALREAVEETAASTDTSTEAGGGTMMDSFQTVMSSYTTEYKTTYRFWLSEKDSYDLPGAEKTSASDLEGYADFYAVAAIVNNTTLTAPEGFKNPTDPTGEGRKFEGWYYMDTYGVTQIFTFDDSPVLLDKSATIDVFAQWGEAPAADPADDADKAEGDTKADDTVKDDTKADDTKAGDTATDDETASDEKTTPSEESAKNTESKANETATVEQSATVADEYDPDVSYSVTAAGLPANTKKLSVSLSEVDEAFKDAVVDNKLTPMMQFNITPLDAQNNTVQPNGTAKVSISGFTMEDTSVAVLHLTNGTVEILNGTVANGTLTFETTSFSPFVVAMAAEGAVNPLITEEGAWVYLYVKVTGDTTGLILNNHGWYTIGKVWVAKLDTPQTAINNWQDHVVVGRYYTSGTRYTNVLKKVTDTDVERYTYNKDIVLKDIVWNGYINGQGFGLKIDPQGADDYVGNGNEWHLDGRVEASSLANYEVHYYDRETGIEIKTKGTYVGTINNTVYAKEFSDTNPTIEYEGKTYKWVSSDPESIVITKNGANTLNLYYESVTSGFEITKNVTGNIGDQTRDFNFTVTVKKSNGVPLSDYTITDAAGITQSANNKGKISFTLRHGQTAQVKGIPNNAIITIEETDEDGYTVSASLGGGTPEIEKKTSSFTFLYQAASTTATTQALDDGELTDFDVEAYAATNTDGTIYSDGTVTIINNLEMEVNTGVILDTLPYVLMLIAVGGGVVAFFLRKRHHDDEE